MGRFKELGQNKGILLTKLIEDDAIVKCLVNKESHFLDIPLPGGFDKTSLFCSQIYPYKHIPTAQTEAKTLISMKFDYRPNGMMYKDGSIHFYIMTHNSLLKTDYGVLRHDFLVNKIDEGFNASREIGIGKLLFHRMGEFIVNENYYGVYLTYKTTEFQ